MAGNCGYSYAEAYIFLEWLLQVILKVFCLLGERYVISLKILNGKFSEFRHSTNVKLLMVKF